MQGKNRFGGVEFYNDPWKSRHQRLRFSGNEAGRIPPAHIPGRQGKCITGSGSFSFRLPILALFILVLVTGCSLIATRDTSGGKPQYIRTSFGLELFFTSEYGSDLLVEEIDSPFNWSEPLDNITLDVFFNISSDSLNETDFTMNFEFDYSFGERAAAFDPETFVFTELVDGDLFRLAGSSVDLGTGSLTMEMTDINVSYNRTYTITGELDLEAPSPVEISSIEALENNVVEIRFDPIPDALGYYLFLSDRKCVNVLDKKPYDEGLYTSSPIHLRHLKEGEVVYISMAAIDMAGNMNPSVSCHRFELSPPNAAPVVRIDRLKRTYSAGEQVYFTCRETHDPNPEDDIFYSWDLDGDGREDSSLITPVFIYDEPGRYKVNLTVTDGTGLWESDEMTIVIDEKKENGVSDGAAVPIIVIIVIIGLFIVMAFFISLHRRRRKRPARRRKRGSVTFKRKEAPPSRTPDMDEEIYWGPTSYRDRLQQWVTDVVPDKLPGKETVRERLSEVRRALPMRGVSEQERTGEKTESSTGSKGKKKVGGNVPLTAAISLDEDGAIEMRNEYFACSKCDEVLNIAVTVIAENPEDRYPISCPVCGAKGEIDIGI